MYRVLVLLSTYNGDSFLREQLESIYSQEGVDVFLLVRDDGSVDNTKRILLDFKRSKGKMTIIDGENIGVARSFYSLMKIAEIEYSQYDYYAFCDQDDVWFTDKLVTAVKNCQHSSPSGYLFYSSALVVDEYLKGNERTVSVNSLEANIVSNRSLGCTQVFDITLLSNANRIQSRVIGTAGDSDLILHDAWVALMAYTTKAEIVYSDTPLIYYRQHRKNVVGVNRSRIRKTRNRIKRFLSSPNTKSGKAKLVLDVAGDLLDQEMRNRLTKLSSYKKGMNRLPLLFNRSLYQYNVIENIGLFFVIMLGRF